MKLYGPSFLILCLWVTSGFAAPQPLIPLRIGFVEGLPVNEPSFEKRRSTYENSVLFTLGETAREIEACGYRYQHSISFFDANDRFAPRERVAQLENDGVGIIVGPGKSDHFLMAALGVTKTPMLSPTGSSNAVHKLPPPLFTLYPPSHEFAEAVSKAALKEKMGKNYGVLVDVTCSICKDFAAAFEDDASRRKLEKKFTLEVASDRPDLAPLMSLVAQHKIDFLVVPNFSALSGYVISSMQSHFPKLKYVGSHSWGDGAYALTQDFPIAPQVFGIGVRIGLSPEKTDDYYKIYSLQRDNKGVVEPLSGGTYMVVQSIREIKDVLCSLSEKENRRLTTKEAMLDYFKTLEKDHFRRKTLLGIWKLQNSKYEYAYEEPK